jgi:hypothetical protein
VTPDGRIFHFYLEEIARIYRLVYGGVLFKFKNSELGEIAESDDFSEFEIDN